MKKSLFVGVFTAIVLCFASCSLNELNPPSPSESHFGKLVGGIDKLQTWNLAQKQSVTVSVSSESLINVYALNGSSHSIVARKTINGTETVYFDAIQGLESVIVFNLNGGKFKTVNVGGSVSFPSTKAVIGGNTVIGTETVSDYSEFSYDVVSEDVYTDAFKSLESASPFFYSKSGTFTLYPCWYTSESGNSTTLGIYYYENGNIVEVPIFANDKTNDWLQYKAPESWGGYWQTYTDAHMPSMGTMSSEINSYHSKGIKVSVPANTAFGFYVIGSDQNAKYYSEELPYSFGADWMSGNLNNWLAWGNPKYINGQKEYFGHIACIDVEGRKYLACDDGCEIINGRGATTPQYYHMVFSIDGDLTDRFVDDEDPEGDPVDPNSGKLSNDTLSWILACEDLGENADYDFNDVVLKISHVAGSTTASVSLLAAGGTLADFIFFGNECLGEVHDLFGDTVVKTVNTWNKQNTLVKTPVYIGCVTVPEDFTMTDENMGGFTIRRGDIEGVVAAPQKGNVPYMICVPDSWKWPEELTSIVDAYPDFAGWCNDHTSNLDWYKNYVKEKVFNR